MCKSIKHVTEESAEYGNVFNSFDYEVRGKRKKTWEGKWLLSHKEKVIRATQRSILAGTFRPGRYKEMTIKERGKMRNIQYISLIRSIGIHAIMNVVERHLDKAFVSDTAASIKGRGCQYLMRRMLSDMRSNPLGTQWVYKDDIKKFYQSTDQDMLMQVVRKKIRDRRTVRILERFVRILKKGITIGLRPSQALENLFLSEYCDHVIKDKQGAQYYRRYCDDRLIQADNLFSLTRYINTLRDCTSNAKLEIKGSAQVWNIQNRPINFLGYVVFNNGMIKIRKTTKQRFARRWSMVRSMRRKRELISSFYGITKHAHSKHLFRKLTGLDMNSFADLGFIYQRDGKKDFAARKISLRQIINEKITVKDFETGIKTSEGEDRYVVLIEYQGEERKFFTNSDKMKTALNLASEKKFLPFETIIKPDGGYGYIFT